MLIALVIIAGAAAALVMWSTPPTERTDNVFKLGDKVGVIDIDDGGIAARGEVVGSYALINEDNGNVEPGLLIRLEPTFRFYNRDENISVSVLACHPEGLQRLDASRLTVV